MAGTPAPRFAAVSTPDGPAFYRGAFTLARPGDTFLDTRGWGKGTVWVNGHHLGRFWDIGPQQTLYVPGPWLRAGRNEVVVFALGAPRGRELRGVRGAVYDVPR
jgi:beta-galactosidase